MTASPGYTYSHDPVGNRTYRKINGVNKQQYTWDAFNRLDTYADLTVQQGGGTQVGLCAATYDYLPNGLRCTKIIDATIDPEEGGFGNFGLSGFYDDNLLTNDKTIRYRYEGQMSLEEDISYNDREGFYVDQTNYLRGEGD